MNFQYLNESERDFIVHKSNNLYHIEKEIQTLENDINDIAKIKKNIIKEQKLDKNKIRSKILQNRGYKPNDWVFFENDARNQLFKEVDRYVKQEIEKNIPIFKERYETQIQELKKQLESMKKENKEAKERYLAEFKEEVAKNDTLEKEKEIARKQEQEQEWQKHREYKTRKEQEIKEYGFEIDDDFIEDLLKSGFTTQDIENFKQKAKNGNKLAQQILENYDTYHTGNGYYGYSMSNNAIKAYKKGLMPLSKWGKKEAQELEDLLGVKISVFKLKKFLKMYGQRGYHHTSKMFNTTNFYSMAEAFSNGKDEILNFFKLDF